MHGLAWPAVARAWALPSDANAHAHECDEYEYPITPPFVR